MVNIDSLSNTNKFVVWAHQMGYYVTDDGRVIAPSGNERSLCEHRKVENCTYMSFTVRFGESVGGKRPNPRRVMVHKLQAYQKFGDKLFEEGIVIRHLDGNSHNNSVDNIDIGTQQENMMDCDQKDRKRRAVVAATQRRRYTDEELEAIFKDRAAGMTYKELAAKYGGRDKNYSYVINSANYSAELRKRFGIT